MGDHRKALTRQRHAPLSSSRALVRKKRARRMPQVYLGRQRQPIRDIYLSEHPGERMQGRFRWLVSTCLAGAVGVLAIAVVISGSMERDKSDGGFLDPLAQSLQKGAMEPFQFPSRKLDGLNWALPKTQRLQIDAGVMSAKYMIRETMRQRQGEREIVVEKPYVRLTSKLAAVPADKLETIPSFNPLALYSASAKLPGANGGNADTNKQVSVKVEELLDGVLPVEDGQQLDDQQAINLIMRVQQEHKRNLSKNLLRANFNPADSATLFSRALDPLGPLASSATGGQAGSQPANTTVLSKNRFEAEASNELRAKEIRAVTVKRGDSLINLIINAGAAPWQAGQMSEAAARIFPGKALAPGQTIYFTLVPSLTQPDKSEVARFSIFAPGGLHKVTVTRNAAGEFVATTTPLNNADLQAALSGNRSRQQQHTSLYASLYQAGRQQGLSDDVIMANMRIHAYDGTDFRKSVRAGDTADFFFDLKDEQKGADSALGHMLYTSLTLSGRKHEFYRFRTSDGRVDYFDKNGNNSKKFLTRKPVMSTQVRLTSGFGMRLHPLLHIWRMHSGVDWAAPRGTPIVAAGNGTVEYAGRKGGNGNYIRIRHANGYKTTYSHMSRIARAVRKGAKIRQGQVIGAVGSTGLSSGPHLHFGVLVNNRNIDPMKMRVPQERRLRGKDLADFQRERARIDDLMHRSPVTRLGSN